MTPASSPPPVRGAVFAQGRTGVPLGRGPVDGDTLSYRDNVVVFATGR